MRRNLTSKETEVEVRQILVSFSDSTLVISNEKNNNLKFQLKNLRGKNRLFYISTLLLILRLSLGLPTFYCFEVSSSSHFSFTELLMQNSFCLSVCKMGFYRSQLETSDCSKCPPHSVARQMGATACSCEDGYYKIDSDPPSMACTRKGLTPILFPQIYL